MLSAQEVADAALAAASDAVDRLVALIQKDPPPSEDSAEAEIVLIEAREIDGLDHRDRRTWENHAALSLLTGARMVVFPYDLALSVSSGTSNSANKQLWKIELIIESDDDAEVERISDEVSRVACPTLAADTADHECEIPWFVITSRMDDHQADEWRNDLNR